LCQSTYRKLVELGLKQLYEEDAECHQFCGMIDGLAFLPLDRVAEGMTFLRENAAPQLEPLVHYFDKYYVSGSQRRQVDPLNPLRVR
jgi:hypothetical protein